MTRTPHEILGVDRTATAEEIRLAYRRMALKTHPDKGGTASEFQEVQGAYEAALALVGQCARCNGAGKIAQAVAVSKRNRGMLGDFAVYVPCPECRKNVNTP